MPCICQVYGLWGLSIRASVERMSAKAGGPSGVPPSKKPKAVKVINGPKLREGT